MSYRPAFAGLLSAGHFYVMSHEGAPVKFRSVPPDPSEFPRLRLVLPVWVPLALILVGWIASEAGHVWNIHGDGALILAAIFGTGLVASVVTLIGFIGSVRALREHESLRSGLNVACTVFAGLVLLAFAICILYVFATRHAI
jgi:hypothetical protein